KSLTSDLFRLYLHAIDSRKYYEASCQHRNLSVVPSLQIPGIKKLDLSYNAIRTLSVKSLRNLSSLRHLDISFNQVGSIEPGALENLGQLRVLILANNQLGKNFSSNDGAFSSLTRLRELDLTGNGLDNEMVTLYLKTLPSLARLGLSANKLTRLTPEMFCGMRGLRQVHLERNSITEISAGTFECLVHLTELNLAMNSLACVSEFRLPELRLLNLSRNAIEFFGASEDLFRYQLQVLDLSHNRLLHFPVLPTFPRLKHLNLSGNIIVTLAGGLPNFPEGWVTKNVYKEVTALTHLPNRSMNFPTLISLDLSNNALMNVSPGAFNPFNSLQLLNLSRNCFQNFTLEDNAELDSLSSLDLINMSRRLPSLKSLHLQNNFVQLLPTVLFKVLPNIEEVNLANNNVRICHVDNTAHCVSFSGILSLKSLNLHGNGIKWLAPHAFSQTPLTHLDLSRNQHLEMADLALEGLEHSLQSLSLRWNSMETADLGLRCLKHLRKLDLAHNLLDSLPNGTGCAPLEDLDVRKNGFHGFQEEMIRNASRTLQTLHLSGNHLNCCTLTWLEILNGSGVGIPDVGQADCFYSAYNSSSRVRLLRDHTVRCLQGKVKKKNPLLLIIFSLALLLALGSLVVLVTREFIKLHKGVHKVLLPPCVTFPLQRTDLPTTGTCGIF
uniref:Uncharacterized protein n=1 Tax=Callorhinchus milii TaxID=7868 RepID=A0A4W3K662_CALMI